MKRLLFDIVCLAFVVFACITGHFVAALGGLFLLCLQTNYTKFDK